MKKQMLTAFAAAVTTLAISPGAWGAPSLPGAAVTPGASDVTIPTYTGAVPTYTVLATTGLETETVVVGETPVAITFDEYAVTTSLNPAGVTFAFAVATTNNPTSLSAAVPGWSLPSSASALMTSVEGCNPFVASAALCGPATGMASRSTGLGSTLTFTGLGTSAVPPIGYVTNPIAVFTNASSFTDPSVTVTDDGVTATFDGIGPAGTASGGTTKVPEPATLGLLGLGLLGTAIARRRRKG